MKIGSMYICVRDMERAVRFYESFFDRPVAERDGIYSVFDIDGFRFGLFAYRKKRERHRFGTNCLPSVEVESLEVLKSKTHGLKVRFPLTKIGKNWVTEIEDTEGNRIEVTAPAVPV